MNVFLTVRPTSQFELARFRGTELAATRATNNDRLVIIEPAATAIAESQPSGFEYLAVDALVILAPEDSGSLGQSDFFENILFNLLQRKHLGGVGRLDSLGAYLV